MTSSRAVRYRRLAPAESDPEKARVLQTIAEEADRGVLATSGLVDAGKVHGRGAENS